MAVSVVLYGCDSWMTRKSDWNKIQVAKMKYFRPIMECTKTGHVRNYGIRKEELNTFSISETVILYRNKWKTHLVRSC